MQHNSVPHHIGIIMDGNRRFAKKLMIKPWKGHEWGAKKLELVLEWCNNYGIKELTLYTLSIQNFNRPKDEFDYLMNLFLNNIKVMSEDERIFENKIRINFIGRLWMLPDAVQEEMHKIMGKTEGHDNFILNFALAYGGREEVIDATKKIAEKVAQGTLKVEDINESVFKENLYIQDEPDLIIRTGGERRTSNFLAFQGAYSEYVFIDKMWPEFEESDFNMCIEEYAQRKRRFGE